MKAPREDLVMEAWYNCPKHGMVHHPTGPKLDLPCPKCIEDAESRMTEIEKTMRDLGFQRMGSTSAKKGSDGDPT